LDEKTGIPRLALLRLEGVDGNLLNLIQKDIRNVKDYVMTEKMQKYFKEALEKLKFNHQVKKNTNYLTEFQSNCLKNNIETILENIKFNKFDIKKKGYDKWLDENVINEVIPKYIQNLKMTSLKKQWILIFKDWLENPLIESLVHWLKKNGLIREKKIIKFFRIIILYIMKENNSNMKKKSIENLPKLIVHVSRVQIAYLNCFLNAFQSVVSKEFFSKSDTLELIFFYKNL